MWEEVAEEEDEKEDEEDDEEEDEEEDVCVYLSPEMVTQRRGWLTD